MSILKENQIHEKEDADLKTLRLQTGVKKFYKKSKKEFKPRTNMYKKKKET